jgi:ABC-type glycerol-3-phosphate transport system permease component
MRWPGDFFFILTLASKMIPGVVTLIPVFIMFSRIGWTNSLLPLIVPGFFGSAFNIFLLRQFFMTIPIELTEAARVDGASHWRILWQIVVPWRAGYRHYYPVRVPLLLDDLWVR